MQKTIEYKWYGIFDAYETRNAAGMTQSYYDEPSHISPCSKPKYYSYCSNGRWHREDAPARMSGYNGEFEWFNYDNQYKPKCQKI